MCERQESLGPNSTEHQHFQDGAHREAEEERVVREAGEEGGKWGHVNPEILWHWCTVANAIENSSAIKTDRS